MSQLDLSRAEVALGGQPILKGIDLEVPEASCLVLLGPSGCGKTTLLNVIAGAVGLGAGTLRVGDRMLDDPAADTFVPMHRRGFSMVFQDFSLWPHMTVAENVAFGLKVRKTPRAERDAKVREALRKVRMADYADRRPASLSGGQQQRISIARALAVEPHILLLDEPLSALDAKLREELKAELKLLLLESRQTAVYVTHDQAEAYTLGDRVALMREGRIEQCDVPEAIYHHPRSGYVADFLGAANLWPFRQENGRLIVDGLGDWPARGEFPPSGQCFLRREALRFEPADASAPGRCHINRFLGGHYAMEVHFDDLVAHGRGFPGAKPGDPVRPLCQPEDFGLIPSGDSHA